MNVFWKRLYETIEITKIMKNSNYQSYKKIEKLISDMLNPRTGVPIGTHKAFLKDIPYAFTGYDLIEWMLEKFDIEDTEALHLANSICKLGYIFPVSELKNLCVKDDSTLYRFQTSFFWLSHNLNNEDTDYAIYLVKRNLDNSKDSIPLEPYEEENLEKLQLKLGDKWEFVCLQAEQQNKLAKERRKNDKVVLDSQERAFWRIHRPPPNTFDPLETTPILNAQPNRNRKKTLENLGQEIEDLKQNFTRCRWKISDVIQSYINRWENYYEFDPFIVKVEPSNPWISDDNAIWCQNPNILTTKRLKLWSLSFKELLKDEQGFNQFLEFLRKEYSSENIRFWQACHDYKTCSASAKSKAMGSIYKEFLAPNAPKEINIDSYSRELVNKGVREGSRYALDLAQDHIYTLMKKDSYVRYLRSDLYKNLVFAAQNAQKKKMILGFNFGNFLHHPHFAGTNIPNNMGFGQQHIGGPVSETNSNNPNNNNFLTATGGAMPASSSGTNTKGGGIGKTADSSNTFFHNAKKNGSPPGSDDIYRGEGHHNTHSPNVSVVASLDKKQDIKTRPASARAGSTLSSIGMGRKCESISSHINVLDSEIHSHNYNQALHPLLVATSAFSEETSPNIFGSQQHEEYSKIQHSSSTGDLITPTNSNSIILTTHENDLESVWTEPQNSPSRSTNKSHEKYNGHQTPHQQLNESSALITKTTEEYKPHHHHRSKNNNHPHKEKDSNQESRSHRKKTETNKMSDEVKKTKHNHKISNQYIADTPSNNNPKYEHHQNDPSKALGNGNNNGLFMKLPLSVLEKEITSPSKHKITTHQNQTKNVGFPSINQKVKEGAEIREILLKSPARNSEATGIEQKNLPSQTGEMKREVVKLLSSPPTSPITAPTGTKIKTIAMTTAASPVELKSSKPDSADICPWEDEAEVEKIMQSKRLQKMSQTLDKESVEDVCPWENEEEVERILKADKEKQSLQQQRKLSNSEKYNRIAASKHHNISSILPNVSTGILSSQTVGVKQPNLSKNFHPVSSHSSVNVRSVKTPSPLIISHEPLVPKTDESANLKDNISPTSSSINEICPWENQEESMHLTSKNQTSPNFENQSNKFKSTAGISEKEIAEICPWDTEEAIENFDKKKIEPELPVEVIDMKKRSSIVHRFSNVKENNQGGISPELLAQPQKSSSPSHKRDSQIIMLKGGVEVGGTESTRSTNKKPGTIFLQAATTNTSSPSRRRSFINRKK